MSEFHEGDTIEAVKGKRRITDVAVNGNLPWFSGLHLGEPSVIGLSSIDSYIRAGYTLTVTEKAAPPLPTTPGLYTTRNSVVPFEGRAVFWLDSIGAWAVSNHPEFAGHEAKEYAAKMQAGMGLTRLEPVADTSARILPQLEEVARCITNSNVLRGEFSTVDVRKGRRLLANLITELEATE